jgi:hypothetical protein
VSCRLRDKGRQKVTVTTVCGHMELLRKRWMSAVGAGCQVPLDSWLGVAEGVITTGVMSLVCLLNRGATSFEHAAECLHAATNIRLGKETLRKLCIESGKAMQQAISKGELVPEWTAKECVLPVAPTEKKPTEKKPTEKKPTEKKLSPVSDLIADTLSRIYLGCDGVLVPLITQTEKRLRRDKVLTRRRVLRTAGQKLAPLPPFVPGADQSYKEFKLSVWYSQDHARRLVSITSGDHEVMGRIIKRDASRLKLKEVDEALGLFDGGPWIDNQMRKQQIPLTDKCLDFYHLKDNIQKTRREVFGDDEAGRTWAHDLAELFKTQGFTAGFDSLLTFRKTLRSPKKKQAATRLVNYVSDRRALITYPEFRAAGRDIGSGPTEAQCKCETLRLKGHGRRWNSANALAISTIEAVHQSRLTEKFWNLIRP